MSWERIGSLEALSHAVGAEVTKLCDGAKRYDKDGVRVLAIPDGIGGAVFFKRSLAISGACEYIGGKEGK